MKKKPFGLILLMVAFLAFCTVSATNATICDDDPDAIPYLPTISSPFLINGILNTLNEVTIVDYNPSFPFTENFEHTLNVVMASTINFAELDYVISVYNGSIEVELLLPAWEADMFLTLDHAPCRDCITEWNECAAPCDPAYDACMVPCGTNYDACVAGCDVNNPLYQLCMDACATARNLCTGGCALARDACFAGCDFAKVGCDAEVVACNFEADLLDNILNGQTITMSYDDSRISQVADVCVTGTCEAVHPHESTTVNLVDFHIQYFPEDDPLGFGYWLNTKVTEMVNNEVSIADTLRDLMIGDEGEALLVGTFSNEIKTDGCGQAQAVKDCLGSACSMTTGPDLNARKIASILLYSLPLFVMAGLILWRRKR